MSVNDFIQWYASMVGELAPFGVALILCGIPVKMVANAINGKLRF